MAIGQFLAGAGVVGQGWRQEEDAQRSSREFVEQTRRAREKFGMDVAAEQQAARKREQEYNIAGSAEQRTAEEFQWKRNLQARQLAELQRLDRERASIVNLPPVTAGGPAPLVGTGGAPSAPTVAPMTGAPRVPAPAPSAPTAYAPSAPTVAPYVGPTGYTSPSPVAPVTPGLNFGTPNIAPPMPGAAPLPMRNIPPPPPPPAPPSPPPTFPTTGQLYPVPPAAPGMSQPEADRIALLRGPAALADVVGAPVAAIMNIETGVKGVVRNVGGRLVNVITGRPTIDTSVPSRQVSLTPFYDRFVRQPEQAAATAASITQRGQIPPTPQLPDPQQLLRAMIATESAGDPNAVSSKGARGLMQVMTSTAMKPGFNLPNIFEFARQNGVEVGKETEAEANRLLAVPALGANYGLRIMDAMLERYNGNLNYALAAYNAGPGRIDKWLADGADPAKLPKETREYVPKVLKALNAQAAAVLKALNAQAAATGAPPVGAAPTAPAPGTVSGTPALGATAPAPTPEPTPATSILNAPAPTAPQMRQASDFYLANPESIPFEAQQLQTNAQQQLDLLFQQRQSEARLADVYRQSGNAAKFSEYQNRVFALDQQLLTARQGVTQQMNYLQGMQGIQEFSTANDPRRLAAVWSQYAGVPIGIQPRSDGRYDILVNGKRTKEGVSANDVVDSARSGFDAAYRAQKSAASSAYSVALTKAQLDIMVKRAEQEGAMIKEIFVEQAKGNIQQALEILKQQKYDIKPTGAGDGTLIITPPGGVPYIFNSSGRTIEIDGVKITPNAAYPIAGLPTYGGDKPK